MVFENYTFLLRGVDSATQLVRIRANDVSTCRIAGPTRTGCSPWIPGKPDYNVIPDVPLPAAAWLFGSALLGLGALKRKKA